MKRTILVWSLLVLVGCSNDAPPRPSVSTYAVAVTSDKTGATSYVTVPVTGPQPPSCAWRDYVVGIHIAWGGAKNDIVTLSNHHKVFIWDVGGDPGYLLFDNPEPWCVLP